MTELLATLKTHKKFLVVLFFASFAVRALVFGGYLSKEQRYWNPDTNAYDFVAQQLVAGNGFAEHDGSPHFHRLPGYPSFIALSYKLFGVDLQKVIWIQIFLAALLPLVTFALSLVLFPEKILLAKMVGLFSVIHLGFVLFSGLAMSEMLFLIFFLLFLIFFFVQIPFFFENKLFPSKKIVIVAGILLGIASLIRPVGHYLLFLVLIALFFTKGTWLDRCKRQSYFAVGWLLIVGWWLARNYMLTGAIFMHSLPMQHFLAHMAANIRMNAQQTSYSAALEASRQDVENRLRRLENKLNRKVTAPERCNVTERLTMEYCWRWPKDALRHAIVNMMKTCFGLYSAELLFIDSGGKLPEYDINRGLSSIFKRFLFPKVSTIFMQYLIYLEIILYGLTVLGFIAFLVQALFYNQHFYLVLKLLPLIGLFIGLTLPCGFARVRLPVEVFLIILASNFWLDFFRKYLRVV